MLEFCRFEGFNVVVDLCSTFRVLLLYVHYICIKRPGLLL